MAEMERALNELNAEQRAELEAQAKQQEVHAGGAGSDPTLYGAEERTQPAAAQLPFEFTLKGDRAPSDAKRPARVRPPADDQTPPETVIGQPTMRLEAATLNPTQQADEPVSEWTLPPEYQETISAFYKRTEGANP